MALVPASAQNMNYVTICTLHSMDKSRFRFPAHAKRYTNEQLQIVYQSPKLLQCVMVDRIGLVRSNFAYAKLANSSYCEVDIVRFSDMGRSDVIDFIKVLKTIAKRNRWPRAML